ncbi:MAG: cytidylyltransferase domain-containing protein [Candidatus Heritagella sp.]
MKYKSVAFVPIKLNNQRLPGKNTRPFAGGKPLLCYILDSLTHVQGLDAAFVYCSSEEVLPYLPEGIKFLKRDTRLDRQTTPILEVMRSFCEAVPAENYLMTHATAPFLSAKTLQAGLDAIISGGYDSATTVKRLNEFVWLNGQPLYDSTHIPRTQDIGNLFAETTGMYAFKRELIVEKGRRIGETPCLLPVDFIEACDINEPFDFDVAQMVLDTYIRPRKEGQC